jgi:uncharacterized protein (UPF0332 family)
MGLSEKDRKSLVDYRLKKAKETFAEIPILIENKLWRNAANRLYYACFYAAMALLIKDGYQARTHSGVRALLGMYYVKTEMIAKELSEAYQKTFYLRQTGDYDDLVIITEDDVLNLIEPAERFITEIEKLIYTNGIYK